MRRRKIGEISKKFTLRFWVLHPCVSVVLGTLFAKIFQERHFLMRVDRGENLQKSFFVRILHPENNILTLKTRRL